MIEACAGINSSALSNSDSPRCHQGSLGRGIRYWWRPSEYEPDTDMNTLPFLPAGWKGKLGHQASPILYDPSAFQNGMHPLELVEVVSFHWELQNETNLSADDLSLHSSLSGSIARSQWHARRSGDRHSGDFRFTIYLGAAWIELRNANRSANVFASMSSRRKLTTQE